MTTPVIPDPTERVPGPQVRSSVKEAARAARAQVAAGTLPRELQDPAFGTAGSGVIPSAGAGQHEGERLSPPQTVTFTDEVAEPPTPPEGTAPPEPGTAPAPGEGGTPEPGTEPLAEGEAPPEWPVLTIPALREGAEPLEVEIESEELAQHIRALSRAAIRREQLHAGMQDVAQAREELAQVEDALKVDPTNFLLERVHPSSRLDVARNLMTEPEIFRAIGEEFFSGLDEQGVRQKQLELENARIRRQDTSLGEIGRRSEMRTQGAQIQDSLVRAIPEDMDAQRAALLQSDLERDVSQYIFAHRLRTLRPADIPPIIEARLELYGVDPAEASERMQDTGLRPLPVRARTAARGDSPPAPARRTDRMPARTGEALAAQADARRRAGAVPGGGAGAPATGPQMPRKQTVSQRIASMRESLLGR